MEEESEANLLLDANIDGSTADYSLLSDLSSVDALPPAPPLPPPPASGSKDKENFCTEVSDEAKPDKNLYALTELATGSLAACSSILEVGKDETFDSKARGNSKIRLYFTSDRCRKLRDNSVQESDHGSRAQSQEASTKSDDICSNTDQSSKDFAKNLQDVSPSNVANSSEQFSQRSLCCTDSEDHCNVLPAMNDANSLSNRRKNFFNDFERPLAASHPSVTSVVKDRAKQFERGIFPRRPVVELKSRSLDPPSGCNAGLNPESYERVPSAQGLGIAEPRKSLDPLTIRRRESETAVTVSADCVWLRRISDSQNPSKEQLSKTSECFDWQTSTMSTPPAVARSVNIQKLKAFFGETTPRIIEAKAGTKNPAKDDASVVAAPSAVPDATTDGKVKVDSGNQKSSTSFDPAGWALDKMSRARKATAWSLANRSHESHSPGRQTKKSSTERDPSFSPKQKEHKTWKGKMVQTLRRYGSGTAPAGSDSVSSEEYTGALGVPLELCSSSFANEFVPLIVETCARIVEEKGLENVGIYRVPGNSNSVSQLIEELNKDPEGLCLENEKWQDVNLVGSLMKLFFRRLPESLITDDLYDAIISANRIENAERRMLKMKKLIHELPEHNFETLRFLAQHLNRVTTREEINKMDAHNLAIVFGPTLVRPQEDSMVAMVRDNNDQCQVIESIILHCDWFFSSWDEDVYVPVDEKDEDAIPISGMNQELLAKAERLDVLRRDTRYKELVSGFLQAANQKIRHGRRKSRCDVSDKPVDPCPAKKPKNPKKARPSIKRYRSERKILNSDNSKTNSQKRMSLSSLPAPCPAYRLSQSMSTGNVQSRLWRTLSCDSLDMTKPDVGSASSSRDDDSRELKENRDDGVVEVKQKCRSNVLSKNDRIGVLKENEEMAWT